MAEGYRIIGAEMSPYSVKVRSYFRYKAIPHQWVLRNAASQAFVTRARRSLHLSATAPHDARDAGNVVFGSFVVPDARHDVSRLRIKIRITSMILLHADNVEALIFQETLKRQNPFIVVSVRVRPPAPLFQISRRDGLGRSIDRWLIADHSRTCYLR